MTYQLCNVCLFDYFKYLKYVPNKYHYCTSLRPAIGKMTTKFVLFDLAYFINLELGTKI